MRRLLAWAAVLAYTAGIFLLSAQENPLPTLTSSVDDKILHAVLYGGLGALLWVALRLSGASSRTAMVAAIALASLYGASDELHQSFVPGRSCEVADWVADTVGAVVAAFALVVARRSASRMATGS